MPVAPNIAARLRGPGHPVRTVACRVADLVQATHDIRIVQLEQLDGGPLVYSAGQYARVAFLDQPERDYSLASRPSAPLLEFHIRNMESGPSLYVSTGLRVGDRARVRGPFGSTYLRTEHPGAILTVAGGSGLAPMKAIVEEALAQGLTQPIHLYFGARDERDVYLEDHFARLAREHPNLRFVPVLSEAAGPTSRRTGLVTDAIAADFPDLRGAVAYLAGPPPMVEAAAQLFPELGMEQESVHADAFIGEDERQRLEGDK